MCTKTSISNAMVNVLSHFKHADADSPEQEQVASLYWSAIVLSFLAMLVSGCGLAACTFTDDLAPHYTTTTMGLAVLSLLPVFQKCLALRRLNVTKKSISGTSRNPMTKDVENCCHNPSKRHDHQHHDDKTQDTRSTCSSSIHSNSRPRHRRQTSCNTTSTHDSEFLKSIRNQKSVLDCRSYSSDDGEQPVEVSQIQAEQVPDVNLSKDIEMPTEEVQACIESVEGEHSSSCSSMEDSRHPLSPTGYISLVKAFSSHSMGADEIIYDTEEAYWHQSDREEEDEDEIPLNPTPQINHSSSSSLAFSPSRKTTPNIANARDALSAMLEETISEMEESSKRMRTVMTERVETLKTDNGVKKHVQQPRCSPEDSRDDVNFGIAASVCGTFNMALPTNAEKRKKRHDQRGPELKEPVNSSPTQYPLTGCVPRLGTVQIHGRDVRMGREPVTMLSSSEGIRGPTRIQFILEKPYEEPIDHDGNVSIFSAPDDEKQQDARVGIEQDDMIRQLVDASVESCDEVTFMENRDLISITKNLGTSIPRIDIRRSVQCYGGIESVASF